MITPLGESLPLRESPAPDEPIWVSWEDIYNGKPVTMFQLVPSSVMLERQMNEAGYPSPSLAPIDNANSGAAASALPGAELP
jgi:hypothetical protein